jgi:ATPase subunit of ABC transporter with duplicated ATPase domains
MSILNVEHLTHGFGDRAIFNDVSFRLLKGEHIGLIGANGEGKSTFMNIITGKLMPDEGSIEWAKNVRVGYLDQHTVLTAGQTIRNVLSSAFDFLYDLAIKYDAGSISYEQAVLTIKNKIAELEYIKQITPSTKQGLIIKEKALKLIEMIKNLSVIGKNDYVLNSTIKYTYFEIVFDYIKLCRSIS